ncbi:MAG: hypothetical protein Q9P01_17230 [Anaerolineae bacterium]|nr:hypothetical protein [Anaerolineae bacterium]
MNLFGDFYNHSPSESSDFECKWQFSALVEAIEPTLEAIQAQIKRADTRIVTESGCVLEGKFELAACTGN